MTLRGDCDLDEMSQYLDQPTNRLDIDYLGIFSEPTRVLCVGDWHVGFSAKDEFIRMVPDLKRSGVTHLGFELLSTDMQPFLDKYLELWHTSAASKATFAPMREKLVDYFYGVWGDDSEEGSSGLRTMALKLTEMVDACTATGIRVIAIEPPVPKPFSATGGYALFHSAMECLPATQQSNFDAHWSKDRRLDVGQSSQALKSSLVFESDWEPTKADLFIDILNRMRAADPVVDFGDLQLPRPEDVPGNFDQPYNDIVSDWRDRTWISCIERSLKDPDARIVVFAGSGHFGYDRPVWPSERKTTLTLNELLHKLGYDSTVIGLAGGDYPYTMMKEICDQYGCPTDPAMTVTLAASTLNVGSERFALRVANTSSRSSDWIIYLPRIAELDPP